MAHDDGKTGDILKGEVVTPNLYFSLFHPSLFQTRAAWLKAQWDVHYTLPHASGRADAHRWWWAEGTGLHQRGGTRVWASTGAVISVRVLLRSGKMTFEEAGPTKALQRLQESQLGAASTAQAGCSE